jgi:hypothetical protein
MMATDLAAHGLSMFIRQACHVLSRNIDGNSVLFLDAVSSFLYKVQVLSAVLCHLQFTTCICSTKCTDLTGMSKGTIICKFSVSICLFFC